MFPKDSFPRSDKFLEKVAFWCDNRCNWCISDTGWEGISIFALDNHS
jgi:hypothetical protein